MHDPFDFTTIIFALLAIFVAWKLRSVLGSRDGFEQKTDRPVPPQADVPENSNVIQMPGKPANANQTADWSAFADEGSAQMQGLLQIKAADRKFEPGSFLNGARAAHEMILQAFAKGDTATLKNLLSDALFSNFSSAITARDGRGEKLETTLIAQDKTSFEQVELQGTLAKIVLRFRSKMITATRDSSGNVIDGSADQIADVQDLWTFTRDVNARDPNWKLVATSDV